MSDLEAAKQLARTKVEEQERLLREISHGLAARPELAMEEEYAHLFLTGVLERKGFDLVRHAYDLPTAFAASAGQGRRHIVLCAEYDALPDIGHACGHNIIGAAAIGAALALQPLLDLLDCRLTVLGTPAEEAVGGKVLMVEQGAFDGVDAALMVHPAPHDMLIAPMLALQGRVIRVTGKSGHASTMHTRKGNALDGIVEIYRLLAYRSYGPYERCHGVITQGGTVPNVIPDTTSALYYLRARVKDELALFSEQIEREVISLLSELGCTVKFEDEGELYREMKANKTLAGLYRSNLEARGREFVPEIFVGPESAASTDMGNVSQVVPSIHPMIGIDSGPYMNHQRGFADAAVSPEGDKAVIDGAIGMAWCVIDLLLREGVLDAVQQEFLLADAIGTLPKE